MIQLARRCNRLAPSPIRDILHVLDQPDMISFAGGLPAPTSFPALPYAQVPASQLQYGASEGDRQLREALADELRLLGLDTCAERVLILSGSQQGIDLVAKLLLDVDTPIAVESPTYLAALQVFTLFGARFLPFESTAPDTLLTAEKPRLIYTIPTFQNPTGHCYTNAQRERLANTAEKLATVVFEDDPYRDLSYGACDRKPICAHIKSGEWIYQSSFSKTLAPGLRLGYMTASESLFPHLVKLKQAADLHSSRISQSLALLLLQNPTRDARLQSLIALYRSKRNYFEQVLQHHFSDLARWDLPKGGLFFWLELFDKKIDTQALLHYAITKNIAFMPGKPFFVQGDPKTKQHMLRLNFSLASEAQIDQGLASLADMIRIGGFGTDR